MGTTQTIRPNANVSGAGAFTLVGGGGTLWGTLSDATDGTAAQRTTSGDKTAVLDMATYSLPADTKVKRYRAAARVLFSSSPFYEWACWIDDPSLGEHDKVSLLRKVTNASTTTYYTAWLTRSPGSLSEQAAIDAIRMSIRDKNSGSLNYFRDIWVELDVIDRPTTNVDTVPTGTSRPTISWVYADGDGDTQTHYEVRVYANPGSWVGFDPDTTSAAPVFQSGEVTSPDASVLCSSSLVNGTTYRAYVRVAHDGGSEPYWSVWDYDEFTVSMTPPTTPTLTATFDPTLSRITLRAVGAAPPASTTQTCRIERSLDAGLSWEAVRGCTAGTFDASYAFTGYDYEAPFGVAVLYRSQARGILSPSMSVVDSDYSAVVSASATADGRWWFKCTDDPGMNRGGVRVAQLPERDHPEQAGVFYPLDSDRAVVKSGQVAGAQGEYRIYTTGIDEDDWVSALLFYRCPLLIQDPFGGHTYVRVIGRKQLIQGTPQLPLHEWVATYVEVAMPATE